MKKVDKKSCLFILVFFLVFGGIVAGLYLTAGLVDIPSALPLADPDYVIRTLPDVSLPYDAVIPPGTATPVNQLYGGKKLGSGDCDLDGCNYRNFDHRHAPG